MARGGIVFSTLRRSLRFRLKLRRAGFRIVGTGTLRPWQITLASPDVSRASPELAAKATEWWENWTEGTDHDIYSSPHYETLLWYRLGKSLKDSPYVEWQRVLRGIDHPRPEPWITAMQDRLIRLYESILTDGYRLECVADRVVVGVDGVLWDGGHRLACLAALGRTKVPVIYVRRRK